MDSHEFIIYTVTCHQLSNNVSTVMSPLFNIGLLTSVVAADEAVLPLAVALAAVPPPPVPVVPSLLERCSVFPCAPPPAELVVVVVVPELDWDDCCCLTPSMNFRVSHSVRCASTRSSYSSPFLLRAAQAWWCALNSSSVRRRVLPLS